MSPAITSTSWPPAATSRSVPSSRRGLVRAGRPSATGSSANGSRSDCSDQARRRAAHAARPRAGAAAEGSGRGAWPRRSGGIRTGDGGWHDRTDRRARLGRGPALVPDGPARGGRCAHRARLRGARRQPRRRAAHRPNHCPFGEVAIEHPVDLRRRPRAWSRACSAALYGETSPPSSASLPLGDDMCVTTF